MAIGAVLSGVGAIGSAIGGLFGSRSANRAARTQVQAARRNSVYGSNVLNAAAYGMGNAGFLDRLWNAAAKSVDHGDSSEILALINSPEYAEYEKATGKPAMQQLMELADQSQASDSQALATYERDMDRTVREATKYGTEQTRVVNDAAALALKNANATSIARMNRMGLGGSTLLTDAMGANAASIERGRAANAADIAGRATGLKIDTIANRARGRASLYDTFASRNNNLRTGIANTKLSLAGQDAGIFTGQPVFQTGANSGVGTALTSLGNTAGTIGGVLLAKDLYGKKKGEEE